MCKKLYLFLIGLVLFLLTACQSEEKVDNNQIVSFGINIPEEMLTRAAKFGENSNSAKGGITNVDCDTKYDIRYMVAIYRWDDGQNKYVSTIEPEVKIVDKYEPVSYSFRLTPNRKYKVVAWADFVEQGKTTDLHYNTSDFENITCIDDPSKQLNDESRDAYFISKDFDLGETSISENLVLRRPFAKVRVVATDWNLKGLEMPDNFKITYFGCKRFKNINLLTGESQSDELNDPETVVYTGASIDKAQKEYALNYDLSEHNRTLTVDYLMTDKNDETPIHLDFEAYDGNTLIVKHRLASSAPIKRNWVTTILGNMLSVGASFQVSIDETFIDEWVETEKWWAPKQITGTEPYKDSEGWYHVTNEAEFIWLSTNGKKINPQFHFSWEDRETRRDTIWTNFSRGVKLERDLDLRNVDNFIPIGTFSDYAAGMTCVFDGQGHTIRNVTVSDKYGNIDGQGIKRYIGVFSVVAKDIQGAVGEIRNLNFENITINGLEGSTDENNNIRDYYTYHAGVIAHSDGGKFSNVHAKHVFIRGKLGNIPGKNKSFNQNVGGLIGYIAAGFKDTPGIIDNCSAVDIHLHGHDQIGGLVGSMNANVKVSNSSSEYVYIYSKLTDVDKAIYSGDSKNSIGGFIGDIVNGDKIKISNCVAPKVFNILNEDGTINKIYKQIGKDNLYAGVRTNADKIVVE